MTTFTTMPFIPRWLAGNGIGRLGRGIQFCRRWRGTGSRECRTIEELEGCGAAAEVKRGPVPSTSAATAQRLRFGMSLL
jgi:hypothetical protein